MEHETMEQWAARVATGMTAEQWSTAELIAARRGWDASCAAWLEWAQGTSPPRGLGGLPPWGLTLAQALLDYRAAAPSSDNPAHGCGAQVVDAASRAGDPDHDQAADWWCPACKVYLGDQDEALAGPPKARRSNLLDLPECSPEDEHAARQIIGFAMSRRPHADVRSHARALAWAAAIVEHVGEMVAPHEAANAGPEPAPGVFVTVTQVGELERIDPENGPERYLVRLADGSKVWTSEVGSVPVAEGWPWDMAESTEPQTTGARGCEADEHGPEDGRF